MQIHALVLPIALTLVGCQAASASSNPEEGIKALFSETEAAWNAHDPKALTELSTADGTVVSPDGTRAQGHAELMALFSSPSPTKQTTSTMKVDAIQMLADDLALVDGSQTLEGPGTAQIGNHAKVVAVVKRVGERWRFVASRPYVPASTSGAGPG